VGGGGERPEPESVMVVLLILEVVGGVLGAGVAGMSPQIAKNRKSFSTCSKIFRRVVCDCYMSKNFATCRKTLLHVEKFCYMSNKIEILILSCRKKLATCSKKS
jgi:hypothetical protein